LSNVSSVIGECDVGAKEIGNRVSWTREEGGKCIKHFDQKLAKFKTKRKIWRNFAVVFAVHLTMLPTIHTVKVE